MHEVSGPGRKTRESYFQLITRLTLKIFALCLLLRTVCLVECMLLVSFKRISFFVLPNFSIVALFTLDQTV